jgi:hypothetical protein
MIQSASSFEIPLQKAIQAAARLKLYPRAIELLGEFHVVMILFIDLQGKLQRSQNRFEDLQLVRSTLFCLTSRRTFPGSLFSSNLATMLLQTNRSPMQLQSSSTRMHTLSSSYLICCSFISVFAVSLRRMSEKVQKSSSLHGINKMRKLLVQLLQSKSFRSWTMR